ncbi:hypothetical protein NLG97_g1587 [Lecanicillium saksenae]|uniref:Uncharacterized protein n=1 Tax=Lecanicillium saksenae TaxID=468837 RepID=A0ACC1R400_9HYPO|nr:hypothetical protein NLG97_g1587 [Lecanicillium saksenae]
MALDTDAAGLGALSGVFAALTTLTLVLRFLARYKQHARFGLDDYSIAMAWLRLGRICYHGVSILLRHVAPPQLADFSAATGLLITDSIPMYTGIGNKFMGYSTPKDPAFLRAKLSMLARTYMAFDGISAIAFGMTKTSAVLFFRRIFCHKNHHDAFHYISLVLLILSVAWTITFIVVPFNLCGPLKSLDWQLAHAKSCQQYPYFESVAITDFILDLLILILPIPRIWVLKTTPTRKIAISGVFLIALMYENESLSPFDNLRAEANLELTLLQSNTLIVYWGIFEAGFNIVAVNGPSMWYLVAGVKPEAVLRSIRSVLSLNSLRSSNGSKHSTHQELRDEDGDHILEPEAARVDASKKSCDSYDMDHLDSAQKAEQGQAGIRVDREVQVERSEQPGSDAKHVAHV